MKTITCIVVVFLFVWSVIIFQAGVIHERSRTQYEPARLGDDCDIRELAGGWAISCTGAMK